MSVCGKKQLGGERVYCLVSDWDVIRQSFVRGIKWNGEKNRQRKPEGDELHHECSADRSMFLCLKCTCTEAVGATKALWFFFFCLITSCVHFVPSDLELQFMQDRVRWLHVYLPEEHEWCSCGVEIKSDPRRRDCSLVIKSAAPFLCRARC